MENQTRFNIGIILALIVGFTTIIVTDDKGVVLEPTHYCESRELKMYCARTTTYYCYPSTETRTGSKKCSEGWKEIPKEPKALGKEYICPKRPNPCIEI